MFQTTSQIKSDSWIQPVSETERITYLLFLCFSGHTGGHEKVFKEVSRS